MKILAGKINFKITGCFIALFISFGIAFSQTDYDIKGSHLIGLDGGINLTLPFIPNNANTLRIGGLANISYVYYIGQHIGIRMGVGYEHKTFNYGNPINFDFININPAFRLHFGKIVAFTGDVGLYTGIPITSETYNVEFGFNISPGIYIRIGKLFTVSIINRNNISLTKIGTVTLSNGYTLYFNNSIFNPSLCLGLNFKL